MALVLTPQQEAAVTKLATREIERVKLQAAYDAALLAWQQANDAWMGARTSTEQASETALHDAIAQINRDYAQQRYDTQQALDAAKAALEANAVSTGEVVKP